MDVIGGRYTCVPEGKHGRGQRDRKVQVFQGTRNLYSRPVDAHQHNGFMCLSGNKRYEAINFENRD